MSAAIAIERHGACACSTDAAIAWHDECPLQERAGLGGTSPEFSGAQGDLSGAQS